MRAIQDLRSGEWIASLRGAWVDDLTGWFGVVRDDFRSELWYDAGTDTPFRPVGRLRDRAVLVSSDGAGKRLIVWEPGGAVLLVAGDILLEQDRNPPATREEVVRVACRILAAAPSGTSSLASFQFGEPFRACAP